MAERIAINGFSGALADILKEETAYVSAALDEVLANAAKDLAQLLKSKSPRDTGAYARGWRRRAMVERGKKSWVVYNVTKPWLTWVIEYGDRNGDGKNLITRLTEEEIEKIVAEFSAKMER